ncbi:mucin-17 [Gallus gallus]|uniref:mucin-17 n=1 Tax=Gallus gallus TaxID=9031 RepID=UPI000739AE8D|nr:mucin-17 [Gallus gallus]|eukprot:XP_015146763.1 mucin-17 [Gallus gallus]
MEGTRRALLRLAAACCLLCALPGEGQKTTETTALSPLLNTVLTSHQLREASDLSPGTTAVPETGLEINVTAAALNATGVHSTEVEDAFISATPVVGTKTERLQTSTAASPTGITVIQREHHNVSLSANSTEIPSPASTVGTLEKNPSDHEVTEPFSTTKEMDDASSATPTPPLNSVPATTNRSHMEPTDGQNTGPTAARAETRPGTSPAVATEVEPSAPISTVGSTSPASTSSTVTMRLPVTSSPAASTAAVPTSTSPVGQQLEPVHEKASVLDVGDDENPELPSSPAMRADPLVITVISVFIVMVGILGLVGFLRYRQHNNRMEFRRLQDLPMDDMMEDTPLSLYSY